MRAAGTGLALIARIVVLIAVLVFLVIAIAVVLLLLGANESNVIVKLFTGLARFLAGPFNGLFSVGNSTTTMAVNWGIAAFVYLVVGGLIAGLLRRVAGRRR